MRLNEIQKQFKDLMLDDPKALENPPEDFAKNFNTGRIALPDRLKVYRNNIIGGLTDVMVASFPAIDKLVGRDFMEGLSRSFIFENPPDTRCINTFGRGFAEFIENFETTKSLPYLPDVARLEIALNDSYYAPDDNPLTPEELSSIPPDELSDTKLHLRKSVFLLYSKFPVDQIHYYCKNDKPQDPAPNLDEGPVHLMIHRPKLDAEIVILGEASFKFLKHLNGGKTLGEALELTMNSHPAFNIQKFLETHLQFETFTALDTN